MKQHFVKLLIGLVAIFAACEVPTRVAISDSAIPPTFKLSGNGKLFHFIVVGPYSSAQELASRTTEVGVIWQLSPDEMRT